MAKPVKLPKKFRDRLEQNRRLKEARLESARRAIEQSKERQRLAEKCQEATDETLKELDGSVLWDSQELDRFEKRAQSRAAALAGLALMMF